MNDCFESMTPEEQEEYADAALKYIGEMLKKDDVGIYVLNPERCTELYYAFKKVKKVIRGRGCKAKIRLNTPTITMGYIEIEGEELSFLNSTDMIEAMKLASNVDVYPKTNGKIKMDLGFHGINKRVKED